jgi:hypothetical protein
MFKINTPKKPVVDDEIVHILKKLEELDPSSKEYADACLNLKVLHEARSYKTKNSIDMDTLIIAGANILGIVLVLYHEKFDIISSKAFGMIMKVRA